MVNHRRMVSLLGALLLAAPVGLFAQSSGMPGANRGPVASGNLASTPLLPGTPGAQSADQQDSSVGSGPDVQAVRDKMFLRRAAEAALAEVRVGQMAVQRGTSPGVQRLGERMVTDGLGLGSSLKPFVEARDMKLPATPGKSDTAEYDRLSHVTAADFDKQFLLYVRRQYQAGLDVFHREETTTEDTQLQEVVANGEQVIGRRAQQVGRLCKTAGVDDATAHR